MAEIFDHIQNIEAEIINSKYNIKNLNAIFKKLITLQKIKDLKEQEISLIEKAKLLILKSIAAYLGNTKSLSLQSEEKKVSKFKKILLFSSLLFTTFVSGFLGFITVRNLLALCVSAANPYVLAASAIVGIVESLIFLVSDAREICHSYGLPFLKARLRYRTLNNQLDATKKIHQLICTVENLNLKSYQESLSLIHTDLNDKNECINKQIKPTALSKSLKAVGQVISGTVATASGFFLAKCVLGLCAAALLTNPIGWIICGVTALLSLSAFYFFRNKSVSKTVDQIIGQPNQLKSDLNKFISEYVEKMNNKMALMVSSRQSKKVKVHPHIQSIIMESKTFNKITFNTYNSNNRFFQSRKSIKSKTKLNLNNVIHRTRLA